MSCSSLESLSNQQLNAACASSHSMLWNTSLLWHTTLHLRHKINFQRARLRDDQLSTSPDIQSASALLNWICRLRTDKYERVCWYCEFESSASSTFLFCFVFCWGGFQPIPAFIKLSRALLPFSYPHYMDCRHCRFIREKVFSTELDFDWALNYSGAITSILPVFFFFNSFLYLAVVFYFIFKIHGTFEELDVLLSRQVLRSHI